MTYRTIYFFAALIFFMHDTTAQKTEVNSIEWKIAGALPATNGQVNVLGVAGPVAGVHNDVLLIGGGANFPDGMPWLGGKKKYHDDLFVLKKTKDSLVNHKSFKLPFPIAYAATCSTPHGVVSVGGESEAGITDKVLLVQWNRETEDIVIKNLPNLPFAVTNASAVFHNNKIYVAGGERAAVVSSDFVILDLTDVGSGWRTLPSLPKPVSHAVMVVQSNGNQDCIYVIGGRKRNPGNKSVLYSSTLQFALRTNEWKEKSALPYALSAGTGMTRGFKHILLFGGDAGETFHKTEELIAAITKQTDAEKKKELNEEKIRVQSTHPGFCRQVLLYDTQKDQWQKLDCIPFDVPVTTTAIQWNGEVLIPSGEIKAGVRTPQILMGKSPLTSQQKEPQRR
jgi:cyclically-permuted mutarotase family protein